MPPEPPKVNLLMVDDEPKNLLALEAVLQGVECNLVKAGSGTEALKHLLRDDFAAILLDVQMPEMDGFETAALVRARQKSQCTPIIFLTAASKGDRYVSAGYSVGAVDYILKPFDPEILRSKVAVFVELFKKAEQIKRQAAALRESEARYRAVSELTSDYAYALSLLPDGALHCEWVTEAFSRITGFTLGEVAARGDWASLVHPDDRATAERLWQSLRSGWSDVGEFRVLTSTGDTRLVCDRGRPVWDESRGRVVRIYGAAQDITERRRAEEALERQALHDALTDLPNRTLLQDRLGQAILKADRDGEPVALLVMDLDGFKEVNDTLGHDAGDLLLQQVGRRVQAALRASDTVARLGGDEFAVVLPHVDAEGAVIAANTILRALEEAVSVGDQLLAVGASIGIALYPEHGADAATLLRRADVAMYAAKRTSAEVTVYAADQDTHSRGRLALMGELRGAIERDELLLHYQPLVRLANRRVVAVEALVRWQHPGRGLIPPDQFIPMAEQTSLIFPLTAWVLDAALRQCQAWRRRGLDIPVSVNLSARSLRDQHLVDAIAALLERHDVEPDRLSVELTESAVMDDPARAMKILTGLREMGVQIAIDDFGTGYSSLAYLTRLPVSELKIDKSFVMQMAADDNDAAIVRSTIELGHNLGLQVVAEGVENEVTWDRLAALGCDLAQGYFMSRPLPATELGTWLAEAPWGLEQPVLLAPDALRHQVQA